MLDGIARQRFADGPAPRVAVIVADNECSDAARATCEAFGRGSAIPITYVREPRRGIPHARNACLEHVAAECEWIAMIDDDEVPDEDWLAQLLACQARTGADVVQGRVLARHRDDSPAWIREGRFFGWPADLFADDLDEWCDGKEIASAATNNVLIRRRMLGDPPLRFDIRFPLLGWDDALFFRTLHARGARIVFADRARVVEAVPPERAQLGYLLRVAYRQGNKKLPIKLALRGEASQREQLRQRARIFARGGAAIAGGVVDLARAPFRGDGMRRAGATALLRVAQGAGMWASVAGSRFDHYR